MFLRILACVLIVMFVGTIVPFQADAADKGKKGGKLKKGLGGLILDYAKDKAVDALTEAAEAVKEGAEWVRDTFGMDSGTCGGEAWCDGCGTPITLYFNSGSCCDPCMGYFD